MNADEREKIRSWIEDWKEIDKVQAKLRRDKIRTAVPSDSIIALDTAFRSALWRSKKRTSSGLVEFHEILARSL